MKQLLDFVDIFIIAPFFLGYLWAADKFCKKFLGASKRREGLFLIFAFCIMSGTVFPAHGKKDSGTIWQRMDRRID